MAAASWFCYARLAYLSRPKSERQLYRLAKRHRICRIVELGIGDIERAGSLIAVAQRYAARRKVCYTALDWFDARPEELAKLTLKQAHCALRATGANVRLVPGAPAKSLASMANAHQQTDLLLISAAVTENDLQAAWFYVPRMLHAPSITLREYGDPNGEHSFMQLSAKQVAELAARAAGRRAA